MKPALYFERDRIAIQKIRALAEQLDSAIAAQETTADNALTIACDTWSQPDVFDACAAANYVLGLRQAFDLFNKSI